MNERIKSLLAQAHLEVLDASIEKGDPLDSNKIAEKFAFLLIRECVEVLYYDDGATAHDELLFEFFGVNDEEI